MKKIVSILLALAFFGGVAFAADFSNIGFVDMQQVFRGYKETEKAQEQLRKEEESFKKAFEESQAKIEKAEKDGKETEEIEKLKKELEKELEPKRTSLLKLNEELTIKLQSQILGAVEKVSKKVGIDLVIDKQVVITGGMDLTGMVLNELNK